MEKKENFKTLQAEFKQSIRDWLINDRPLNNVPESPTFMATIIESSINYYDVGAKRIVKIKPALSVIHEILDASIKEAEFRGAEFEMTKGEAADCLAQAEATIVKNGFRRLITEEIKPIAFSNDDCYCFNRLPIPRIEPDQEWIEAPRKWEHLGPFMNSIREAMADYNEETGDSLMFRRLLSAIGQLLWDATPSREIVYWYGKGGDGKTTLTNFIASKLGNAALPNLRPKFLESEYYVAQLEGKRMVIAEEAGKGQFLTEGIKAITGNRFLTGRNPHERIRSFESHVMIWYTSNELPIIDGEDASKDRLRLIQSEPRKNRVRRDETDIRAELELWWPHIIDMSVTEYFAAGKGIHKMPDEELKDSVDSFYLDADGWIEANLMYEAGAFMPVSTIKYLLNHKVSIKNIEARIKLIEPQLCDSEATIFKRKRRLKAEGSPVWGWQNVGLTIGHYQGLSVPWIAGPKRR